MSKTPLAGLAVAHPNCIKQHETAAHLVVPVWPCTSDPCRWWWVLSWTPWRQHFLALNPRAPRKSWAKLRQKASPRQKARSLASEKPFSHPGTLSSSQVDCQFSAKSRPHSQALREQRWVTHTSYYTKPDSTNPKEPKIQHSSAECLSCHGNSGLKLTRNF